MILSVPEGDDKPLKYPLIFSVSDLMVVNKIDYLEGSDFNLETLRERALRLNPGSASCRFPAGRGRGFPIGSAGCAAEIDNFRRS